ncbi:hypothetical protein CDL12_21255 [Handroanthus impetiginosus]|uniref:Uncharacterized protein n=1 Tax=Handroanthus impetiginosus TaxID=429701 RepID=A0A2G9GLN0_9LAMI|nr:hypothetical protein CDL12_21255 [Handroanthus impetiginosus]
MRTVATLLHSSAAAAAAAAATRKETFSPPAILQRSPWHSPVPYLFGGLAAMLGLIAFALLILACSYWKLSGQVNGGDDVAERDVEGGAAEKCDPTSDTKVSPAFEEKFLVIMAGEVKPTFLATPMKASSSKDENLNSKEKETKEENQTQTSQESQVGQEQIQT